MSERRAIESPIPIGKGFARPFNATIPASWGAPTGAPTLTILEHPEKMDVTATTTSGANSIAAQVITTKSVLRSGMTVGKQYEAILEFPLVGGGVDSCDWLIDCED